MKTAVFLQARMNSQRLPRKILMPLNGLSVIEHCMANLKNIEINHHILLCDYYSYRTLEPYAKKQGFEMFCGPTDDVLRRFALAVKYFKIDMIIRATADNPLVSSKLANELVSIYKKEKVDYSVFHDVPGGTSVDVINGELILEADAEVKKDDAEDREHVAYKFIRDNDWRFDLRDNPAPEKWHAPDLKVSIDTIEEYDFVQKIFADLYEGEEISIEKIIEWSKGEQD